MVCNQTIFERQLDGVKFIALVSKELKNQFTDAFA
jgi:hypothetical protein